MCMLAVSYVVVVTDVEACRRVAVVVVTVVVVVGH